MAVLLLLALSAGAQPIAEQPDRALCGEVALAHVGPPYGRRLLADDTEMPAEGLLFVEAPIPSNLQLWFRRRDQTGLPALATTLTFDPPVRVEGFDAVRVPEGLGPRFTVGVQRWDETCVLDATPFALRSGDATEQGIGTGVVAAVIGATVLVVATGAVVAVQRWPGRLW